MTPSPSRVRALLVLALLAGLLGMHGLNTAPVASGPAGPAAHHGSGEHTGPLMPAGPAARTETGRSAASADTCAHADDGPARHVQHADGTCVAAGTASAPPLPLPQPGPAGETADRGTAPAPPGGGVTARAPPSLSELQLLRI